MGYAQRANKNSFKKKIGTLKPLQSKMDKVVVLPMKVLTNVFRDYMGIPKVVGTSSGIDRATYPHHIVKVHDKLISEGK